ncbi:MAG: ferritin family protein [Thermodesulfobacteriota bacterium]
MFVFGTADDVFAMAVRIEENGKAFYEGAASGSQNEGVKTLFQELAQMEQGHIELFRALRSTLAPSILDTVWDPEGLAESYLQAAADTHVFSKEAAIERLKAVDTPEKALDMALLFEKDSVAFFLGMKSILEDPKGKGEIDQLIEQEQSHIRMLSNAKKDLLQKGATTIPGSGPASPDLDTQGRPKSF